MFSGAPEKAQTSEADVQQEADGETALVFRKPGTLHFKRGNGAYAPVLGEVGSNELCIFQITGDELSFVIKVVERSSLREHMVLPFQEILRMVYSHSTGSVLWTTINGDHVMDFAFRFVSDGARTPGDLSKGFIEKYNLCTYCLGTQQPLPEREMGGSEDEDYTYVASTAAYEVPMEIEEEEEGGAPCAQGSIDLDDEVFEFSDGSPSSSSTGPGKNHCFAESITHQREIVVKTEGRGKSKNAGQTVVQAHAFDLQGFRPDVDKEQFALPSEWNERTFSARDAVLVNGDTRLLLTNQVDPSSVAAVDLARGEVVECYQPGHDYKIESITPVFKSDPSSNVFACVSRTSTFAIDTRLDPRKCAVVEATKTLNDYAHKWKSQKDGFTCHATSAKGQLAIGDHAGTIRLFSGPPGMPKPNGRGTFPKAAKTLLRGSINNPILHLDISNDGEYVLATCARFLLLLDTKYADDNDKPQCGFESRMGQRKPLPLKLTISPHHILALGGPKNIPEFSKATFECSDAGEQWISASAGPLLMTWSMKTVKAALQAHRMAETCDVKREPTAIRSVKMGHAGRDQAWVTFMTNDGLGMEFRSSQRKSGSKYRLSFGR